MTGKLYDVEKVLDDSINGDFTLVYPSSGEIRSAVIQNDINGDGKREYFAFYSTTNDEQVLMHLNVIIEKDGNMISADTCEIAAAGVDKVDFCDLDNDGVKEILVGWEIYANTEKQLGVYSFSSDLLGQRMLEKYSEFICCDIDENNESELIIQSLNIKELQNKATVFKLDKNGVSNISSCKLDGNVKSISSVKLSHLSTGQVAVYIDEIKGIGAVTEILFMQKGELKNPLLDIESGENILTLRSSNILSSDVNKDDIPEIPIASKITNADITSGETLYYTNWCSFNGEGLTVKQVSIVNSVDGYTINIPKKWIDSIAVSKDVEKKTRTVYAYNAETGEIGEKIVTFKTVSQKSFKEDSENIKVNSKAPNVFVAILSSYSGPLALTKEEYKKIVVLNGF